MQQMDKISTGRTLDLSQTTHGVMGIDVGIKAAATFSNGASIEAPNLLKAAHVASRYN
ncbi:hypothetical protein [Chloroflexus sp.]|uniref:hypothetical protein n=1 Tax=Chloroflexus sp. TaxID=1904827 RepID=UPI003C775436